MGEKNGKEEWKGFVEETDDGKITQTLGET